MKTFVSLFVGCCLTLAGVALGQQPQEQQSPAEKKGGAKGHRQTSEAQPGANQGRSEAGAGKRHGAKNQQAGGSTDQTAQQSGQGQGAQRERAGGKRQKKSQGATATQSPAGSEGGAAATASPNAQQQAEQRGKHGRKGRAGTSAQTAPSASPAAAASTSVAPNAQQTGQARATGGGARKRLEPQKVQQIKSQHASFRAQPRPDKVPAVTFNQSYRIQGAERWQGPQYEVYRSYHPEWHDQGWYRSRFGRVELIGGGYYYFNNGYWFPAWGYDPGAQYYAYDAPIYVGHRAEPPDRVIADVQAALQDMGYYRGEVDGLLGPLTREAVTAYQADNGLTTTAVIDEPTLDSLGMS